MLHDLFMLAQYVLQAQRAISLLGNFLEGLDVLKALRLAWVEVAVVITVDSNL